MRKRRREILQDVVAGTRCRVCHRKLTNPKSVARGIGPVCWGKMFTAREEDIKQVDNLRDKFWIKKYGWDMMGHDTRCNGCGMPIDDLSKIPAWEGRFVTLCIQYCCACCPDSKVSPCAKERLEKEQGRDLVTVLSVTQSDAKEDARVVFNQENLEAFM